MKQMTSVGTLLDAEFDEFGAMESRQELEDLKFFDDPAVREGRTLLGASVARTSRRKRKTVSVDDPETVTLQDEEPLGWAEP